MWDFSLPVPLNQHLHSEKLLKTKHPLKTAEEGGKAEPCSSASMRKGASRPWPLRAVWAAGAISVETTNSRLPVNQEMSEGLGLRTTSQQLDAEPDAGLSSATGPGKEGVQAEPGGGQPPLITTALCLLEQAKISLLFRQMPIRGSSFSSWPTYK